jgi:hypothetical protein
MRMPILHQAKEVATIVKRIRATRESPVKKLGIKAYRDPMSHQISK